MVSVVAAGHIFFGMSVDVTQRNQANFYASNTSATSLFKAPLISFSCSIRC